MGALAVGNQLPWRGQEEGVRGSGEEGEKGRNAQRGDEGKKLVRLEGWLRHQVGKAK